MTVKTQDKGQNIKGTSKASVKVSLPRRRTELGLLVLANLATIVAFFLAKYGLNQRYTPRVDPYLVAIVLVPYFAHLANRISAPETDPAFLPIVTLLNGIGFVMIDRLDRTEAHLQVLWTALGVGLYILTLVVVKNSDNLDRFRYILVILGIGLVLSPLVPGIGENINGERLWIHFGPLSFQPVEAAKLLLALFFASYLTEKSDLLKRFSFKSLRALGPTLRSFGPLGAAWAIAMMLMAAERDVGFALLIFATFIVTVWLATANRTFLWLGSILFVVGAFVASKLFAQVNERFTIWLDPWKYAQGIGYQIVQAQYALGTGGYSGTGLGQGHPSVIPVVTSDFIFAAIGEELGLLGTTAIVFAFLIVIGAGLRAAMRARSQFSSLVAASFTLTFGLQTFFIISGVIRILPLTGVTLPFVAYGGSSLVANYVLIAVLARISHEGNEVRIYGPQPPGLKP